MRLSSKHARLPLKRSRIGHEAHNKSGHNQNRERTEHSGGTTLEATNLGLFPRDALDLTSVALELYLLRPALGIFLLTTRRQIISGNFDEPTRKLSPRR